MKTKITKEQWELAAKWLEEGVSNLEVAKRLGVSPGRVSQKLGKRRERKDVVH